MTYMKGGENGLSSGEFEGGPRLWGWHTFASVVIALSVLVWISAMVDLERVWREFLLSEKRFVVLGALLHYATYPVRGLRWKRSLSRFPLREERASFGLLVFFYNFVDNIVPAKLGDLYGAHLGRINFGIRRSVVMGSIVFLRMLDAWVLLGLGVAASWMLFADKLPPAVLWSLMLGGIVALAVSLIMLVFFILKRTLPDWVPNRVQLMIHAFHDGMLPKAGETARILFYTLVIWTLETLWMAALCHAFDLHPGVFELLFVTVIPIIASAFPITPSGVGVVEVTLFGCLRLLDVSSSVAASLTVVNRFIDYWLHIALGLLIWVFRNKIGLVTWNDIPLEDTGSEAAPRHSLV